MVGVGNIYACEALFRSAIRPGKAAGRLSRAEVAAVILLELGVVVALAQPLGWLIGHGLGLAMVAAFSSDLYRVPFIMGPEVYATASLIVIAAALLSHHQLLLLQLF